jgi:hypothetical protein
MRRSLGMAVAIAVPAISMLNGCGGGHSNPTAVRVGKQTIGMRDVGHWTSVIARGALVAGVSDPQQSPRQQALALLIGSDWLIGEALRSGLRLSKRQLVRMVQEQKNTTASSPDEFQRSLAASGESRADVTFEAMARWAASNLAQRLTQAVEQRAQAHVTDAVVTSFYRAHIANYRLPEQRFYDLHESISTRSQAVALAKMLGSGPHFAERANKEKPFRPTSFRGLPGQAAAYRAIFAAKIGVLTGPIPLQGHWCLFVIRRIEPARVQPLSEVRRSIEQKLLALPRRRARAQLIAAYRRRWLAQTDCRPGYVVQKCREYRGPRMPEPEPFAGY